MNKFIAFVLLSLAACVVTEDSFSPYSNNEYSIDGGSIDSSIVNVCEASTPSAKDAGSFDADSSDVPAPSAKLGFTGALNDGGAFIPRDGAGLVALGSSTLLLLGGWDPYGPPEFDGQPTTNEVWRSLDHGLTWSLLHAHDSDPPATGTNARWRRRHTAGWLRHIQDGIEYAYVIGGDHYDTAYAPNPFANDVWRSKDAGDTWERVAYGVPWGDRMLHMAASFQGSLYVMGGQSVLTDPSTAKNDVWKSSDGGATWSKLGEAPWAPRGMVYNPVVFQNKLWIAGGGTYSDDLSQRSYYNDVWCFDGTNWTQVLANGHQQWSGREYHNVAVAGGRLWLLSGFGPVTYYYDNHNDVYSSVDGITWDSFGNAPWPPSHADGLAYRGDYIFRVTGNSFDTKAYQIYTK